jgi:hypothetical protein
MIILAFFFLLRPGEYTDNNKTPFWLKDIQLFIGPCSLNLQTLSMTKLAQACFGSLTFIDQKNSVRGEVIGQASAGNSFFCPFKALVQCVLYLQSHNAPPTTPLSWVFNTSAELHHQFSPLPSETLSSILALILGSSSQSLRLKYLGCGSDSAPPSSS